MRILLLSLNAFPYPPTRGGDEVRTFNFIRHLSRHHDITLVTHRHAGVTDEHICALEDWVTELKVFPKPAQATAQKGIHKILGVVQRMAKFAITATPPNVETWFSPAVQNWIRTFVQEGKVDAILCEHSVNSIYIDPQWKKQLKTIVDIHSSVYGWTRNHLEAGASENALRDKLYLPFLARYERSYCRKFSHLISTTPYDRQQLLNLTPNAEISVIPNGVDLVSFPFRQTDPQGHHLIFVGAMNATHNIDAALFIAQQIFPELKKRYPQATLSLVGNRPIPKIQKLNESPGITVTGRVPSVIDYIHQATVGVVALRAGLGIKNKTLEFMAGGVPVVASDRGLEGLTVDDPKSPLRALRANQVDEYVDAISRLFEDQNLRQTLSQNARHLIETEYTWEIAGQRYEQVLSS